MAVRVKSGGTRVLSSPPLLFALSNRTVRLSSPFPLPRRVAAPNAFHPRGADYIDRFMIAALLQGLEGITRGVRIKQLSSFASSAAGCRYILVEEYLARASPGTDIQGAP